MYNAGVCCEVMDNGSDSCSSNDPCPILRPPLQPFCKAGSSCNANCVCPATTHTCVGIAPNLVCKVWAAWQLAWLCAQGL